MVNIPISTDPMGTEWIHFPMLSLLTSECRTDFVASSSFKRTESLQVRCTPPKRKNVPSKTTFLKGTDHHLPTNHFELTKLLPKKNHGSYNTTPKKNVCNVCSSSPPFFLAPQPRCTSLRGNLRHPQGGSWIPAGWQTIKTLMGSLHV